MNQIKIIKLTKNKLYVFLLVCCCCHSIRPYSNVVSLELALNQYLNKCIRITRQDSGIYKLYADLSFDNSGKCSVSKLIGDKYLAEDINRCLGAFISPNKNVKYTVSITINLIQYAVVVKIY